MSETSANGMNAAPNAAALTHMSNAHVDEAYTRWAPFYDLVFEWVMRDGRVESAAAASRLGGLILDVGVGTGLELPMFSRTTRVVGVDLCEPMLRRARLRAQTEKLDNVEGLLLMDATRLAFPDDCFDGVVAPYVLTIIPNPMEFLDELARVVRPGGELILANHIGAEKGFVAAVEKWLGRHSKSLGWRPEFPWSVVGDWIASRKDMRLLERRALKPVGLFTLIRIQRAA